MAGKFDLKSLKAKPLDVQRDIDNTEKNRISEKTPVPVPEKTEISEVKKTAVEEKKIVDITNRPEINTIKTPEKPEEKSAPKNEKDEQVVSSTKVDIPSEAPKNTQKEQQVKHEKKTPDIKLNAELISLRDENSPTSVSSINVPEDIKNYLKCMPKLKGETMQQFLGNIFIAKQEKYIKAGIDINEQPDFSKMASIKIRSKSENLCIVPLKLRKNQNAWLKKAALYNGQNISQFIEDLIREEMKK